MICSKVNHSAAKRKHTTPMVSVVTMMALVMPAPVVVAVVAVVGDMAFPCTFPCRRRRIGLHQTTTLYAL